jgi:hypothetical protein
MLKLKPFDDTAFCQFLVIGRWSVKDKHHVPLEECCLSHSPNCTVTGGKVKLPMLFRNPGFVATLVAHEGRATEQIIRAEAAKLGYGDEAASSDVFWRANARVRNTDNSLWEAKRRGVQRIPFGSVTQVRKTFDKYFVAFYLVRDVRVFNRHGSF